MISSFPVLQVTENSCSF